MSTWDDKPNDPEHARALAAQSMIERVARALSVSRHGIDTCWKNYMVEARAAIAAMREPTGDYADDLGRAMSVLRDLLDRWADERGMNDVLKRARELVTEYALRHPTRAMIDAALEGK